MGNKSFMDQIRKLRNNSGLSMEKFAETIDATKSSVNMWENKGVVPRNDTLIKISTTYKISIDELLGNDRFSEEDTDNIKLNYIQRNLKKLDDTELQQAENILKTVFMDIFENGEDDDDDF